MTTQSTFDYVPDEPVKKEEKPKTEKKPHPDAGDAAALIPESEHEIIPPGTGTALVVVNIKKENALTAFTTENGLDPYLKELETRARAAIAGCEVSTIAGADTIRSVAYSLSKSKKPLENLADDLKKAANETIDKVNHERDRGINFITDLQKELRRPLTEYEEREKARIAAHKQRLEVLAALPVFVEEPTSEAVRQRINNLTDFNDIEWQEYTESAKAVRKTVEDQLADMLVKIKKAEDDAAELARLRAAEDERNRRLDAMYAEANTDNVAFDAAAKAKKDAEEEAERQRVAREEQVEKDRLAAEKKAKDEQDALQRQKDESDAKVAKAEEDRIAAHKQAIKTINDLGVVPDGTSSAAIQSRIDTLEVIYKRDWQEFHEEAADKFNVTRNNLVGDHTLAVDKEAVEKAKADKKALDDALKLAKDNEAAAKKVIDDATAKRNADTAHKAKINNAAVAALAGVIGAETQRLCEEFAKEVVIAIASGKIPNVTITY